MSAKVHVSPPQQQQMKSTLGINIEETVVMDLPGSSNEHFARDHKSVPQLVKEMLCPCCCISVPLVGAKNKIEYYRQCGVCSCPYAVKLNGEQVGRVKDVGCCDNGCMFCCCPCLTCSGKTKVMGMANKSGDEVFVFTKELFPCWPCLQSFAMGCAPLGMVCVGIDGCCHYCNGTEFKSITQPVYKGPWTRGNPEPEKVGEMVITQRFRPVTPLLAIPTPLKYYFKPTSEAGAKLAVDELVTLSLAMQLYRGMPAPCANCSPAGFQMPTGVWCLDLGMQTKIMWSTLQQVMQHSTGA